MRRLLAAVGLGAAVFAAQCAVGSAQDPGAVSGYSCDQHAGQGNCLVVPVPIEPTYTG